MKIVWKGKFEKEKAFWKDKSIIEIDKKYFRPTEVNSLKGNFSLAKKELNWKPKISFDKMIKDMLDFDIELLKKN